MSGSLLIAQGPYMFDPASPSGESIRSLFIMVLAITGAIFLLVEGVLLYSIVRFRRRASEIPPSPKESEQGQGERPAETTEPPQVYGSMPIEIAWTAAPFWICFLLALILARTGYAARATPPAPQPDDHAFFTPFTAHH